MDEMRDTRKNVNRPGLPDGIFAFQKSLFGCILEGLEIESVGIFYQHLVYFISLWYILWSFGIYFQFGMLYVCMYISGKIWQPS
jgi:hypothetical protein